MKIVNEEQFKNIISGDLSQGVFLVFGNEAYLKKHYCNKIMERFDDGTGFNLQKFDSSGDIQQLYNAVCQMPFLSEKKCVSICDVDFEKVDKGYLEALHEAIDSVGSHCVLLIWYCTEDGDISKEKSKAVAEHIEKVGGVVCKLDKKSPAEISRILCNGAAKRGCLLDSATARYMIDQCSDDLTNLVTELDKLCAFVGDGGKITPQIIDKVCIRTVDVKTYQLGSAIIAGNTNQAMLILDDLLYMGLSHEIILGALVAPFADIVRLRLRNDRSLGDVAADFSYGKRDFVLKNALSASNKLVGSSFDDCIDALNLCDKTIKSSMSSPRIALEQLVVTLCSVINGR